MDADSADEHLDAVSPPEIPPEITLEVAERFCPLRLDISESWRRTLQEIRQSFSESTHDQETLKCVLTHSVVPEWPERPDGPYPSEVDGMVGFVPGATPLGPAAPAPTIPQSVPIEKLMLSPTPRRQD